MIDPLVAAREHLAAKGVAALRTVIVLGSGLGEVAERVIDLPMILPYSEIPGMPASFVGGHRGELFVDARRGIGLFLGRAHLYEGISARDAVFAIRVAHALGAQRIILTNAAGSLDPAMPPGSLVLISDHLNLTGKTPLDFSDSFTPRPEFLPMVDAYSPHLRAIVESIAAAHGIAIRTGIYAGVHGPAYETPAEAAMLHILGASIVGMSTVIETIAARALGMDVLGLSLVTNYAGTRGTHAEVLEIAAEGTQMIASLLASVLAKLQ